MTNPYALNRRAFLAASGMAALSAAGLSAAADKEEAVRIGIIGVGGRGTGLMRILLQSPHVSLRAICDINEEHLSRAVEIVERTHGAKPDGYSEGPYDYRRMLERDDLDAVLIATPAALHAEMAADALRAGKDVGSEVPGAHTLDECWNLVRVKEETGRRYMLLENYNYARERMMTANMAAQGAFGELVYAECSYIHDCNYLRFNPDGSLTWRGDSVRTGFGNMYPTHALGPVSKWLGVNDSDRFVSLTSCDSRPDGLKRFVLDKFGEDSEQARIPWTSGGMNVTLIKTEKNRLITVYYDTVSPRPQSIFYLLQGDKGVFDSRSGIYLKGESPEEQWEPWQNYLEKYDHDYWRLRGEEAAKTGHGGGDYFSISDFVEMVRKREEPYIDVYDSAAWSAVLPLSQESIRRGGDSVDFPDFTVNRA